MGSDQARGFEENLAKQEKRRRQWFLTGWRPLFDWRLLLSSLGLGTLARHSLVTLVTLSLIGTLLNPIGLGVVLLLFTGGLALDLSYTLLSNYRYEYQRRYYENEKGFEKTFEKAHPDYASLLNKLSWMNLGKYAFRGLAVAISLAILITGVAEPNLFIMLFSAIAGGIIAIAVAYKAEQKNVKRIEILEQLKHDRENRSIAEQACYADQNTSLFSRCINKWDIAVALIGVGALGRRSLVTPRIFDKEEAWLSTGSAFLEIILPVMVALVLLDIIYSFVKAYKTEVEIRQQQIENEKLFGATDANAPSPDPLCEYDKSLQFTEKALGILNLVRYPFRMFAVVTVVLLIAGVTLDVYTIAYISCAALPLGFLAENSETNKQAAVDEARGQFIGVTATTGETTPTERSSPAENVDNNNPGDEHAQGCFARYIPVGSKSAIKVDRQTSVALGYTK